MSDVDDDTVGIFIGDIVVVVDVRRVVFLGTSSVCDGGDGRDVAHGPSDFVDGVDALFDEWSGAEPLEVEPVAELPFNVGHAVGLLGVFVERLYG